MKPCPALLIIYLVLVFALVACEASPPLDIPVEAFEIQAPMLPETWTETRSTHQGVDGVALNEWQQRWVLRHLKVPGPGFDFSVREYATVSQAKDGYRGSLRRLREIRYTIDPRPEWGYDSPYADQYEVVCSPPETMGAGCVAMGRYVNYVALVGLDPGDGLMLTSGPDLFRDVDIQVWRVIEAHQAP